jgi:hypothetical protein
MVKYPSRGAGFQGNIRVDTLEDLVLANLFGGGERDRTDDLLLAKQALSQLSYTPTGKNLRNKFSS